jgi:membrane protease YdiL (CAAX protease family)
MNKFNLLQRCEFVQRKPYSGQGESAIAFIFSGLWFFGIWLRLGSGDLGQWTLPEKLWEASSFVMFGAIPIFGLATPLGERVVQRFLLPREGLGFQLWLCLSLGVFVSAARLLGFPPEHFEGIQQLNALIWPNQFWGNTLLWLGGVFVAARFPFLMLAQRQVLQTRGRSLWQSRSLLLCLGLNTLYLLAVHTNTFGLHPGHKSLEGYWISLLYILICGGMTWAGRKRQGQKTTPVDFFLMVLCIGILYWLSVPSFRFGVCVGVDLFIVAGIYGLGLGRAHFGYSFQLRGWDAWVWLRTILMAAIVLIPLSVLTGFVQPSTSTTLLTPSRWVSYFLLFSFRVGIFEEVFFRSGLMVFIRDAFPAKASPRTIAWWSAGFASVVFGLVHVGNEPGAASQLAPIYYKSLYIALATVASLFYSLAFGETNRLTASIWIHGFVDTTAVVLLGGFLAVPF